MKKIAVVTMGVKLGNETKGYDRFKYIATMLAAHGYEVDLITTSFQHWEKAQRNVDDPAYLQEPFNVVFIAEPGYQRNLDLKRIQSHAQAAKNLAKYFDKYSDYSLVYAEIPPNDVALACVEFCERAGIPFVADVNDLWPEAMYMALDIPVVSKLLFSGFEHDAHQVYTRCSAVVGTSDEYAQRPLKDRTDTVPTHTVYVGNDVAVFDQEAAENAEKVVKPAGEYWATYAGTIGASYDIQNLVYAAEQLKAAGHTDIRFKILGGGPDKEKVEQLAASKDCQVDFVGYLPHAEMAAYLVASDVTINSFAKKAPQSIVTKIGDYLACGKPMINTLLSPEFCAKVTTDGFGVNVEPENPTELAGAILALKDHPARAAEMGAHARTIAETQFDRPHSYQAIVQLIDELTA